MGIQVYGFWRSIASFRVRVALKLKDLPFEEIPIDILSGEQFLALTGHDPAEISAVLDTTLAGLPDGLVRTVRVGKPDSRRICSW